MNPPARPPEPTGVMLDGKDDPPQHDTAGLDKHYSPRAPESIRDTPGNGYLREK